MDLTDISYDQAAIDLNLANQRIVGLTIQIATASSDLIRLRENLSRATKASNRSEPQPAVGMAKAEAAPTVVETHPDAQPPVDAPYLSRLWRKVKGDSPLHAPMLWSLDEICGRPPQSVNHSVSRSEHRVLTLRGWALPAKMQAPFDWIEIVLSNSAGESSKKVRAETREDIAVHFKQPAMASSGFVVTFQLSEFMADDYKIDLIGYAANDSKTRAQAGKITIL